VFYQSQPWVRISIRDKDELTRLRNACQVLRLHEPYEWQALDSTSLLWSPLKWGCHLTETKSWYIVNWVRSVILLPSSGMATSKGELLASILYPEKMLFKYDEELPIVVLLLLTYGIVCFAISIVFQVRVCSSWSSKFATSTRIWLYCPETQKPRWPVILELLVHTSNFASVSVGIDQT